MREGSVSEAVARQLVGRDFEGGTFTHYESRGGKFTMVAKCSQCGGPHSGISIANAAQQVNNPNVRLINCQHCTYVVPNAAKQTYEEVIRIPENQRTSAQDRIIVEHEFAQRSAQRAAIKQAPIDKANKAIMWRQHDRYLVSLAHSIGARSIIAPEVLNDDAYISWEKWQTVDEGQRYKVSADVDAYFESNSSLHYEG
jgi:hypothetical protein